MKTKLLLLLASLLWGISLNAQRISGKIVDVTGQPVSFASVALLAANDSSFVAGDVSGQDGLFAIESHHGLPMIVRVSSIGYKTLFVLIKKADAGTITLTEDSHLLGGIEVKGHRPSYRLTKEGLQTSVAGTVLSRLGTAEDVLAQVPLLTKKDGAIVVYGKGAPLIYINGRQMRDASELDRIKSEDIENVEVITSPGARYDASVSAVVIIKTRRPVGEGFGFDVRSSIWQSENTDLVEQLNWNYRRHGLDIFGTTYYSRMAKLNDDRIVNETKADTLWQNHFLQNSNRVTQSVKNTIGANYMVNDSNSVGFRYTLETSPAGTVDNNFTTQLLANGLPFDKVTSHSRQRTTNRPGHTLNAYYNGKVGLLGIDLNADYLYSLDHARTLNEEYSQNQDNRLFSTWATEHSRMVAGKLVLTYPLWGGELMAGAEYTHTHRVDNYEPSQNYVPSAINTMKEDNVAPFFGYGHALLGGVINAGVRYEWVRFRFFDNGRQDPARSRTYANWFPNLSWSVQTGNVQWQMAYAMKVNRPRYYQLSNNTVYGNRYLMQTGNPLLKNELIHSVDLTGVWKWVQFSAEYTYRSNPIAFWSYLSKESSSVLTLTSINMKNLKYAWASLSASPTIGLWSPVWSVSMYKQWFEQTSDLGPVKLQRPMLTLQWNNNFSFAHGWTAGANFTFTTKGDQSFNRQLRPMLYTNIYIRKSILNDKLNIYLGGNDLTFRRDESLLYANRFSMYTLRYMDSREVTLTLRYSFNATRNKYKGTGAGNQEKDRL